MTLAADYGSHWDSKFKARPWGRYPPEELVRFVGRQYGTANRNEISVLEVGCGPGANIWFLHREGFDVAGVDISPTAIEQARDRLAAENSAIRSDTADLRAQDFSSLPWSDNQFDLVIDIFAVYANPVAVIDRVISEIYRVIKPGGRHFCKLWGTGCTGFGAGRELEPGTFDDIPVGPCAGMGVAHFFTEQEISERYAQFEGIVIDRIERTDRERNCMIEEFVCCFTKAA